MTDRERRRWSMPWLTALVYFLSPSLLFLFTSLPGVGRLTPYFALVVTGILVVARFLPRVPRHLKIVLWTVLILSLVGSTGWFFSPFFFALYLLAIGLGFLYTPTISTAFLLGLLVIFSMSIGEVNPTYDFLTLLSLLAAIPLTIMLRRSFLIVQQERKGILILESEDRQSGITSLDAILKNQVNRIGILLRQPLTYVKQGLSLLEEGKLTEQEYPDVLARMRKGTEEMFTLVKEFESETTKNPLLGRGKKQESS